MKITETSIEGAYVVEMDSHFDVRGSFNRMFCKSTFENIGLNVEWIQHNLSINPTKHTIRGMHFQLPPHEEIKLVSCVKGEILDNIVDLRRESPTFMNAFAIRLKEDINTHVYIPKGVAHGYQTIESHSSVFYLVSTEYRKESSFGVRYNDKSLSLSWHAPPSTISNLDESWPDFIV